MRKIADIRKPKVLSNKRQKYTRTGIPLNKNGRPLSEQVWWKINQAIIDQN